MSNVLVALYLPPSHPHPQWPSSLSLSPRCPSRLSAALSWPTALYWINLDGDTMTLESNTDSSCSHWIPLLLCPPLNCKPDITAVRWYRDCVIPVGDRWSCPNEQGLTLTLTLIDQAPGRWILREIFSQDQLGATWTHHHAPVHHHSHVGVGIPGTVACCEPQRTPKAALEQVMGTLCSWRVCKLHIFRTSSAETSLQNWWYDGRFGHLALGCSQDSASIRLLQIAIWRRSRLFQSASPICRTIPPLLLDQLPRNLPGSVLYPSHWRLAGSLQRPWPDPDRRHPFERDQVLCIWEQQKLYIKDYEQWTGSGVGTPSFCRRCRSGRKHSYKSDLAHQDAPAARQVRCRGSRFGGHQTIWEQFWLCQASTSSWRNQRVLSWLERELSGYRREFTAVGSLWADEVASCEAGAINRESWKAPDALGRDYTSGMEDRCRRKRKTCGGRRHVSARGKRFPLLFWAIPEHS